MERQEDGRNHLPSAEMCHAKIFFGGLGQITGGMTFAPDFNGILNRHPFPDVAHGCLTAVYSKG